VFNHNIEIRKEGRTSIYLCYLLTRVLVMLAPGQKDVCLTGWWNGSRCSGRPCSCPASSFPTALPGCSVPSLAPGLYSQDIFMKLIQMKNNPEKKNSNNFDHRNDR